MANACRLVKTLAFSAINLPSVMGKEVGRKDHVHLHLGLSNIAGKWGTVRWGIFHHTSVTSRRGVHGKLGKMAPRKSVCSKVAWKWDSRVVAQRRGPYWCTAVTWAHLGQHGPLTDCGLIAHKGYSLKLIMTDVFVQGAGIWQHCQYRLPKCCPSVPLQGIRM